MSAWLGIDIGSVSLNIVVIDSKNNIVSSAYVRTSGRPVEAARKAFADMMAKDGDVAFSGVAVTGSGKDLVADALGALRINEIVAHAMGAWTVRPDVASVIEIGGQDSKYIQVGRDESGGHYLKDHSFNELCAAGTGAFLDQQAGRLGLPLVEFSGLAAAAEKPARLSGRCSVFAKSDMIHLQQKATPVGEIAAGLCFALARNYLATLCRGRTPVAPVLFQGGVASNDGVVRAFRELLGMDEHDLVRPPGHDVMGAFGAAIHASKNRFDSPVALSTMIESLAALRSGEQPASGLNPIARRPVARSVAVAPVAVGPLFLGLDVGSVSTKAVVIDSSAACVASAYLPTAGRPVEAVRSVVARIAQACAGRPVMDNVCCTGSGRYLASALIGGGDVLDEISAQASGAAHFVPDVDTIIEIGGQDSKYIKMNNGVVERFQMNRACAAGTGAFLEEQCGRLGIDVRDEFARLAMQSSSPVRLGSRCTVFMDSDLVHHVQLGTPTADICAGLSYSIGQNYLEKVVGSRPIGQRVLFQGGVARNEAVHSVFCELLDRAVEVHPMPEVSGAFGAALQARDNAAAGKRFDLSAGVVDAVTETFECRRCSNLCEIRRVRLTDGRKAFFGSICGRFDRDEEDPPSPEDAFATRERLLLQSSGLDGFDACGRPSTAAVDRGRIGIPFALSMTDYLPFWNTFLTELGFSTVLSGVSSRDVVTWGLAHVPGEFCYPIKVLFGHVHQLMESGINRLFLPHLRMFTPPTESIARYACPYTQAAPYVVRENVDADVVTLEYPVDGEQEWWIGEAAATLKIPVAEVRKAHARAAAAQAGFVDSCRAAGTELLERLAAEGRRGCVLLGRPYNTVDRYVNLNLARRLSGLGIEPIPFDFMPLGDDPLPPMWDRVRWGYGRKLLQAARVLKHHGNLGAVIMTNFGCGPDSFVDQYLETELALTPHIVLEMDDHQAEAGLVTRLEAFSRNFRVRPADEPVVILTGPAPGVPGRPLREYTYYVPSFMDHAYAFTGALKSCGCKVVLLPPTDDESWELGMQHAYGRECHPFISFAGDLLKAAKRPDFVAEEACYFAPSYFGPCLLPQYLVALHLILRRAGLGDVAVLNISDPPTMRELGKGYVARVAMGIYAIDRLFKWKTEIEPREANRGEVDAVHRRNVLALEDGLANGRFFKALRESVARFAAIPLKKDGARRPVVGIVGDVYTRVNEHSNDHLYKRLNDLGFDVWTSCSLLDVSILGGEQLHRELDRRGKRLSGLAARAAIPGAKAALALIDRYFPDYIKTPQERHFPDVYRTTSRYTSYWIDKALSANINRIEEFHGAGADGVINVMCHNCMLGNVTASLSASIRRDMDGMPLCNLVFEGLKSTHSTNRLEAFAHQVTSTRQICDGCGGCGGAK